MTYQSILPERITVTVTRAPMGAWVAESQDLLGFSVMSNNESSLRALINEHIVSACRAQGFEVATGPIGNVDNKTVLWSLTVRNASRATGPTKVGGTGREHTWSNRRLPLLMTMRAGLASPCCTCSLRLGTTALRFAFLLVSLRHGQPD